MPFYDIYIRIYLSVQILILETYHKRFNHSCASNAEIIWRTGENDACEIRCVSKINPGEEITINYSALSISMKKLKSRQEILSNNWGFHCHCELCEQEQRKSDDEEYEKYEKMSEEAEKLGLQHKNLLSLAHKNMKREIFYYKEMYKLAQKKKASRQYIHQSILTKGFNAALYL